MTRHSRRRRLQICASNPLAHRPDLIRELNEHDCTVETEQCLDQCTRCESCAFAMVNGRFVYAPTPEELVRKLR
ncbi:MAG TPA: DUF1450 domain-containing protein [Symbiobacteriaceae bacterium]|nr:DUF1450 domain-containing protein [Symbiobacteriaceae bacterium]